MCSCPAHHDLVDCICQCDHTNDRLTQWQTRAFDAEQAAVTQQQRAAQAEAEVFRLRGQLAWAEWTSTRGWWNWPLVQWWWWKQYRRRDRRAFRREVAEIYNRAARGDQ
jgi:hypothetical protein